MNAKEMFEKLGYRLMNENENTMYYRKRQDVIEFNCEYMEITVATIDGKVNDFTLCFEELEAIHQQMKELGWIE